MFNQKENNRISYIESILLVLILYAGILIFNQSNNNNQHKDKNSVRTEVSILQSIAIVSSDDRQQVSQKILIQFKDYFRLFSISKYQVFENKKIDLKISLLQNICKSIGRDFIPLYSYRLFQDENDEIPLLS